MHWHSLPILCHFIIQPSWFSTEKGCTPCVMGGVHTLKLIFSSFFSGGISLILTLLGLFRMNQCFQKNLKKKKNAHASLWVVICCMKHFISIFLLESSPSPSRTFDRTAMAEEASWDLHSRFLPLEHLFRPNQWPAPYILALYLLEPSSNRCDML